MGITQFPCFVVSKDTSHLNLFVPSPVRRNRPLTLHFPMSKRNSVRMANGSAATDGVVPSYLLTGKVALVTGSGRGMGRETALELARRGADVVVNYANSSKAADELVAEIKAMGRDAIAVKANVSDVSQIIDMFAQAKAHFGKLDIVVSNINTRGQFFVAREAYKNLEPYGRIILMGSITGQAKGVPKHTVYSGSKGAIETFVRCMAIDCGDKKITVNAVAPGGIKTDMYHAVCREYIPNGEKLNEEQVDEYAATWSPMNRVGLPIDVARVTAFLASTDGEWINGKVLGIDGAACM